jgi:hypothetical protein
MWRGNDLPRVAVGGLIPSESSTPFSTGRLISDPFRFKAKAEDREASARDFRCRSTSTCCGPGTSLDVARAEIVLAAGIHREGQRA